MNRQELARELFERHHSALFRYLWRMTGLREVAEDLTQDVFVRAFRALPSYQPRDRDRAWLFQIARRLLLDYHRSRTGHDTRQLEDAHHLVLRDTHTLAIDIDEALHRLADIDRDVFLLREIGGLGYQEIASVCDLTPDAVRSRICRARAALRAALRPSSSCSL